MAEDKRTNLGCWTIIVVFSLVIMSFLLIVKISGGQSVGTFEVVGEIVLIIILLLLRRSSRRLKRGARIEVLEDFSTKGERLVNASDFEVGKWGGPFYLSLSVIVKTDGEKQWLIRLRTSDRRIGEIRDGAELLFKNANGELMEIYNTAGRATATKGVGLLGNVLERKGMYPINLEVLDALCSWEFVKIRVINELRPLDVDVKGQNLANLFKISRNVIEKALDPENTIYSGM